MFFQRPIHSSSIQRFSPVSQRSNPRSSVKLNRNQNADINAVLKPPKQRNFNITSIIEPNAPIQWAAKLVTVAASSLRSLASTAPSSSSIDFQVRQKVETILDDANRPDKFSTNTEDKMIAVVTGISGSGRIELLQEIAEHAAKDREETVEVHDVGELIAEECRRLRIPITDKKILDVDRSLLQSLRASALRLVENKILKNPNALHLVGVHATFRWKSRLIPGVSYADLVALNPDILINIVRNAAEVSKTNGKNPKWEDVGPPDLRDTQEWMVEEEFATEILADVIGKPVFIAARDHNVSNLADLFFTTKKKIYLSYPITAVHKENPDLLKEIQGPILDQLQQNFVVFNPLSVKDMPLTYDNADSEFPELVAQLTPEAKQLVKTRTIERDYQFIDQSDAVVVFYLTDKLSPGVLGEIYYAHRTLTPVFMCFPSGVSPFLEDATDSIKTDIGSLLERLQEFAKS